MSELPFAKKSLGQHWLSDAKTLMAMCEAADINAGDIVLEIGPGIGTLTKFLTQQAKRVVAVEFDRSLAQALPGQLSAANLEIVNQDILKFDLTSLPPGYKIVANIPYYLTSHLIRIISESPNPPSAVALLVQKEVAERVTAGPGNMSILGVTAQFYWDTGKGAVVPAQLFIPPPKVDSQIVTLRKRKDPLFDNIDEKKFFRLVKAGFSAKRKTLLNSLSGGLRLSKPETENLLKSVGINPAVRAQELSLEEWHKLYLAFNKI